MRERDIAAGGRGEDVRERGSAAECVLCGVDWDGEDASDEDVREREGVRVREFGLRNATLRYFSKGDG